MLRDPNEISRRGLRFGSLNFAKVRNKVRRLAFDAFNELDPFGLRRVAEAPDSAPATR